MQILPWGTWPSPLTPESMAAGQVSIDEVRPDGANTWWLEGRPLEGGRQALVRHDGATGTLTDVLAEPWNVRSRVHEYGGGAYAVRAGRVVFTHFADNRLYVLDPGESTPRALTPRQERVRFGGLVLAERHVFAVREDHRGGVEPVNTLVVLALEGDNTDLGTVLVHGPDFVLRPAVSSDGDMIAWVEYDHPNMPWDATRLRRARIGVDGTLTDIATVAEAADVSVVQPQFSPTGHLWFASDASGWWTLMRDTGSGPVPVHQAMADHVSPQWSLGMVDYALLDDDRALVRWWADERAQLGVLDATTGAIARLETAAVQADHLHVVDGDLVARVGFTDRAPSPVRGPVGGALAVLSGPAEHDLDLADVSPAEPWQWSNSTGLTAHGILHRPRHSDIAGPPADTPPLLVMVHGGPTSRAEATFSRGVQFWTTRGWAVLVVNYSGSTGYGRAYRNRLRGQWGVADIDDCVTGATSLAQAGIVDGSRTAIRGGSAGGYAVLRAMTTSSVFRAGTSLYGVGDLAALAEHTHKFESRYCDLLVAPWPESREIYDERSPIHHVDRLRGALLLLQGTEDLIVPVAQATEMAAAMTSAGGDVDLVVYDGEGHGFRRADTIIDACRREVEFYRRVFGLA